MSQVIFFIAAIGALTGAIGVVALRNPFYSVLALVFHLVSLAALFLLLHAEFVAAAQVVVYAGAVMVLYVFVVAYIGGQDAPLGRGGSPLRLIAPLCGAALLAELLIAMLGSGLSAIGSRGAPVLGGFGTPRQIGRLLLTDFLFVFEAASILLLVSAVGAVLLARRRRGLAVPDEPPAGGGSDELIVAAYTGSMAEAVEGRRATITEGAGAAAAPRPADVRDEDRGGW